MGGFLGIGGSSAKTDRKSQLTGFGDLQNLFNFGLDNSKSLGATGTATTAQGTNTLGQALNYFQKLNSGDRTTTAQAVAPEANAIQQQTDAQRRQAAAMGTARGGGTAGKAVTAQDDAMAKIDNSLFQARPAAAGKIADIGSTLANLGLGETGAALGFGQLAESGAANLTDAASGSYKNTSQQAADLGANIGKTLMSVFGF